MKGDAPSKVLAGRAFMVLATVFSALGFTKGPTYIAIGMAFLVIGITMLAGGSKS